MNPLSKRLALLRFKVRLLDGWQGACALIALAVGVAMTVGVLDYVFHLPNLVRALALVGLLVGGGAVCYRFLVRPFSKECDDLNLALRVEEAFPELNDALASTVQFLKQSKEEQARLGGSEAMRARTVEETIAKANQCDFSRILDRKAGVLFGAAALLVMLVGIGVAVPNRGYAGIALLRFLEPFGQHTWTKITVAREASLGMLEDQDEEKRWPLLDPKQTDRIARGKPYRVRVHLVGQIPKQARIEIDGQIRTDKVIELKPGDNKGEATFDTSIDVVQQYHGFKFRIVGNDGSFPPRPGSWQTVEILAPPTLVDLDGQPSPQITVFPPAYTDLRSPDRLPAGTQLLELYAGTRVVLRAKANRPLEQAWIEFAPTHAAIKPGAALAFLGDTSLNGVLSSAAAGNTVWGRIPAEFEEDKTGNKVDPRKVDATVFQIEFLPRVTGTYVLHLRDKYKLDSSKPADVVVKNDPAPEVKVIRPTSAITALPDADIPFRVRATDEFFAVRSVFVEYRERAPDGTPLSDVKRIMVYDARHFLPQLLGRIVHGPADSILARAGKAAAPDHRLRLKELDFSTIWSLNKKDFKEGSHYMIEICADDFCDLYSPREPGRSQPIELRIVSKGQLTRMANDKLGEIKKQLERIAKNQDKAMQTVKDINKKDKISEDDKNNLIEAEQAQRQVQDEIGKNPDQGLRKELRELRQLLRDNKQQASEPFKEAGKTQGTLDHIAQQELPQIEPKLADARNELAQNDKNTPKAKKNLEDTAKLQENVLKAIAELNKELAPKTGLRDTTAKLQDILDREKQLKENLEKINKQRREEEKDYVEDKNITEKEREERLAEMESRVRNKLDQKAKEQLELAAELEKTVNELKDIKKEQEELGNKDEVERLKKAIDKLVPDPNKKTEKPMPKKNDKDKDADKDKPLSAKMKDIASELNKSKEAQQKELDKAQDIAKQLEKALDALESTGQDSAKQDIKDRQDAEKKLEKLAREIKQLRDEAKQLEKEKNMEERLKKKQELLDKHDQMKEKLEKAERELARLQEQQAANELRKAAEDLEKAKAKLQQDDNPQPEQKDAQAKVREAIEDLRDAEEELARELMIKIAEKLQGLKERQDASLQRSEDFQPKLLKRKSWTTPFLDTIDGNIGAQKGIAEETDTLKEKLAQAKVFAGILERAKESMDKATKLMEVRQDEGKARRYIEKGDGELMDKKELEDEAEWHADTVKHQKQAAQRLDRLLDALKQEIAKKKKPRERQDVAKNEDQNPEEKKEKKGGMRAQDGIPPMAQLKALRSEQLDLNERTEDFAKRNPDTAKLDDKQRMELVELEQEQERLQSLFRELVAPPMDPLDPLPEPKEGGKK